MTSPRGERWSSFVAVVGTYKTFLSEEKAGALSVFVPGKDARFGALRVTLQF